MRTIKFRGKRVDNGEWVYGDLLRIHGVPFIYPDPAPNGWNDYEVIPDTVGQFTGLLDKNGKEIYEGYIVEFGNRIQGRSKVVFDNGCFMAEAKNYETALTYRVSMHAMVIGNIYDNPEMLKQNE